MKTFQEYGLRFDIEENFLDDKSNGFQLESSLIRSAPALTRLCLVLAMTTLYLVSQGVEVVKQGKRRWVDPHWFRGQSYLKIGWNWVKLALSRGWTSSLPCTCPVTVILNPRWPPSVNISSIVKHGSLSSAKTLRKGCWIRDLSVNQLAGQ